MGTVEIELVPVRMRVPSKLPKRNVRFLPDRPAERAAELVLPVHGLRRAVAVREEVRAVQLVVAEELEGGAVQLVGARLQVDEHRPAHAPAVLRGEIVGDDAELAHCVDRRLHALRFEPERPAGRDRVIVEPVDHDVHLIAVLAAGRRTLPRPPSGRRPTARSPR